MRHVRTFDFKITIKNYSNFSFLAQWWLRYKRRWVGGQKNWLFVNFYTIENVNGGGRWSKKDKSCKSSLRTPPKACSIIFCHSFAFFDNVKKTTLLKIISSSCDTELPCCNSIHNGGITILMKSQHAWLAFCNLLNSGKSHKAYRA